MSALTEARDEAVYDLVPDDLPAARSRPRVLLVGTALVSAAIVVGFAALVGIYLRARHGVVSGGEVWFADGQTIGLTPANIALGTMAMSCVTMQWAVDAIKNDDRNNALFALAVTLFLGVAVVNATSFLWAQSGFTIAGGSNAAGLLFYALTGSHLALLVAAMVFVVVMALRTLGGDFVGGDREGVVAASMVWYVTTGILAVIWYAVYVTK